MREKNIILSRSLNSAFSSTNTTRSSMAPCLIRDVGRFLLAAYYVKRLGFCYDRGYGYIGVKNSGSSIIRCSSRQLKQSASD